MTRVKLINQAANPSTPAAGSVLVYSKTDKKVYYIDDAGLVTGPLAVGGGVLNLLKGQGAWNNTVTYSASVYAWSVDLQSEAEVTLASITVSPTVTSSIVITVFGLGQYVPSFELRVRENVETTGTIVFTHTPAAANKLECSSTTLTGKTAGTYTYYLRGKVLAGYGGHVMGGLSVVAVGIG